MLINKDWDFETAVNEISNVYRPGGITTGQLRNRQIEAWGQLVGKTRSVAEFDDAIKKYGSLSAFGKEYRVTVPILRHFREFFESLPDDKISDKTVESKIDMIKAFISYSWDNDDLYWTPKAGHKNGVSNFITPRSPIGVARATEFRIRVG